MVVPLIMVVVLLVLGLLLRAVAAPVRNELSVESTPSTASTRAR